MSNPTEQKPKEKKSIPLSDLILALVIPFLIGKVMIIYFGLNYSRYPDEGYGYGLCASIGFTLFMTGRFLWRNRNYED